MQEYTLNQIENSFSAHNVDKYTDNILRLNGSQRALYTKNLALYLLKEQPV